MSDYLATGPVSANASSGQDRRQSFGGDYMALTIEVKYNGKIDYIRLTTLFLSGLGKAIQGYG